MPYISICSSVMLDLVDPNILRVSNAYVESHHKNIKYNVLKRQTQMSIGATIRELKDRNGQLVSGDKLGSEAHLKRSIKGFSNGYRKDIYFYSKSKSSFIRIGKFKVPNDLPTLNCEIEVTCKNFHTLVIQDNLINGQIIDAYALSRLKYWNEDVSYLPTDDTRTAVGDYNEIRRKVNDIRLYSISKTMKNILIMPYVFQMHWRLLIVNINMKTFTLIDPLVRSLDDERVLKEFYNFIRNCTKNSTFGKLKGIPWIIKKFKGERPYQPLSDLFNCGIYVMYMIDAIASNKKMSRKFNPNEHRKKLALSILSNFESNVSKCGYCLGNCKNVKNQCNNCF